MGCCGRGGLHFGQIGSWYGVLFAREPAIPSANLRCRLPDLQRCQELKELPMPRTALDIVDPSRRGVDGGERWSFSTDRRPHRWRP